LYRTGSRYGAIDGTWDDNLSQYCDVYQTLLHVSAYQRHHQGAHIILTSYLYVSVTKSNAPTCFGVPTPSSGSSYDPHKLLILYVGVHYKKNNAVSSKLAPVSIVTLWIHFGPSSTTVHWFQQHLGRVPQQFIASNSTWAVFHNSSLLPTALGPCSTKAHCFQQQLAITTYIHSVTILDRFHPFYRPRRPFWSPYTHESG
jgi:hypothetical protein